MTSLVVVSAGVSTPSSTRMLADRLASAVAGESQGVEVTSIELREIAHQVTNHLLTGFPDPQLARAIEAVRWADGLIAVTPVFSATFSGLFKSFFDILDQGHLEAKPVLVAATAGTPRHSLVLEHALRPLLSHLRAIVAPTGVFAAIDDFGGEGLEERIAQAARELSGLMGQAPREQATDVPRRTGVRRRTVESEFADPTPFDELLRHASGSSA